MKSIDADISENRIKNIYVLYGVEPYLIYQYRDKLVNALVTAGDNLNYCKYSADEYDMEAIKDFIGSIPFFAEHKVLVLENTGLFKKSCDELCGVLESLPETSYVIFTECFFGDKQDEKRAEKQMLDKRMKLYKVTNTLGRMIFFPRCDEMLLKRWLVKRFKDAGYQVNNGALDMLLTEVGDDMYSLYNESEKLICYKKGSSTIDASDVKNVCAKNLFNDIFTMVSAIATKNKNVALKKYYDLLSLKITPMNILALISREFNLLLKVKLIKSEGGSNDMILRATGINQYFIGKYVNVAGRFSTEYLKEAVVDCVDTETRFKQGLLNDLIGVEMLIIKYSGT